MLWRLGDVSIARAQFVYDNHVVPNGGVFEVRRVHDTETWETNTLFGFPGSTTDWHPTSELLVSTSTCDNQTDCTGTFEDDLQHFRDLLESTPDDETYQDLIFRVQPLFGGDVGSQVVAAQRAAKIMFDNWSVYQEEPLEGYEDMTEVDYDKVPHIGNADYFRMALGYIDNTESVPMIPNSQTDLRGALAYALHDQAFYNVLVTSSWGVPDGRIYKHGIQAYLDQAESDAATALSWYGEQDTDKYSEIRNQIILSLLANRELLDTAAVGEGSGEYGYNSRLENDGAIEHEDFAYYANNDSDLLALMRQVSSFVLNNPAIFFQLDTGGSVFHPVNRPDGLITIDDITGIAGYINLSPESLTSYVQQSLLIRGVRGNALLDSDLSPSSEVRGTLTDILMTWDGYYLLETNPDGIIESDKIDELESMLDRIIVGTFADEGATTWIGENLNSEFQHWFAESPDIYLAFQSYIEVDYTHSDAQLNVMVMGIYDEESEDYESTMNGIGEHFQPLSLFPSLSGLHVENYRKSVELATIIDMATRCEVNNNVYPPTLTCDDYTYEGEELNRLIWETYSYMMGEDAEYTHDVTDQEVADIRDNVIAWINVNKTLVGMNMAYLMFDFNSAIVADNLHMDHTFIQGLVLNGYVAVGGAVLGVASMIQYIDEYHEEPEFAWIIISYVSHLIASGFEYAVMYTINTSIDVVEGPIDRIRQMNPHSSGSGEILDNIDASGREVPYQRRGALQRQNQASSYHLTIERLEVNAELRKLSYDHRTLGLLSYLDIYSTIGSIGFAYLAYQSLEQAIADGNTIAIVFSAIDFGVEVASGVVTLMQLAVAMLKVPGAAVFGAINSGLALVAGLVSIIYTIYQIVHSLENINDRIDLRRDVEQVFTARIVEEYNSNRDSDAIISWTASEHDDWWDRSFQGGDGDFGDCDMDDYFTVGLEGDTCDDYSY